MTTPEIREKVHNMKTYLSVIDNFISYIEPADSDTKQLQDAAKSSLADIKSTLEELDDLVHRS